MQTYLERDLQSLRAVENLADFRRLMRAAALRLGNLLNQTELGRDTGINQPQVHRLVNLMEESIQIIGLQAYSVNRRRRLSKAPKLYWGDTALAMHLAGQTQPRGPHPENLILTDLITWRDLQSVAVRPTGSSILAHRDRSGGGLRHRNAQPPVAH